MEKFDIIAIGECLIDFVCTSENGKLHMEGNPGGAPANMLAMAAKLGHPVAMITKVGADAFGEFLRTQLNEADINTGFMRADAKHPTTLAIVKLDDAGNRSFGFYRDRTADVMLCGDDLPKEALQNTRILHFGSLSLTAEPSRSATLEAVNIAKLGGALISYDPNLRLPLWPDEDTARDMLLHGMQYADVVKASQEEVEFLTGEATIEAGAQKLCDTYKIKLLAVTCGANGCMYQTSGKRLYSKTFDTPCIDTTGAGDASWGAALSCMLEKCKTPEQLTDADIYEMMDYANAAGSLATTKTGGIPAMPTRGEICECIKATPRL